MVDTEALSHSQHKLFLRTATTGDLDGIVRVVKAGFPDAEANHRYPRRDQYPSDFLEWTCKAYKGYLEQPKKFAVQLIEAPDESNAEAVTTIALAVWEIAVLTKATGLDQGLDKRRDANKKHCELYNEAVERYFKRYFSRHDENQMHLCHVVTHPDYRRRGAGTMLMEWGIKSAAGKGWPVTVFATPMGELLYCHLGFNKLATEEIQGEAEEEKVTLSVMELRSKK